MVNITPVAKAKALTRAIKNKPMSANPKNVGKPVKKVTRNPGNPGATIPGRLNKKNPVKVGPVPKKITPIKISPIEKPGVSRPMNPNDPGLINRYLTNDTAYQSQQAAINKALGDYGANELQAENQYNTQYTQNAYELGQQKDDSFVEQENDYAGRGFLRSGGHVVADSKRRNEYANRQSNMDMQRGSYLQNLRSDKTNFESSQALASQQARQDAINRRALGLLGGG